MAYRETIKSHDEYLEVVEQYKDYKVGTYKSMALREKMDFFDGIHTDRIPRFNEDGDDMDTFDDYCMIKEEFLSHPEMFSLEDILSFMEMLDDWHYQPSDMQTIVEIIKNIACSKGIDGVAFLVSHFKDVPECGRWYGMHWVFHFLIREEESYMMLKEAVKRVDSSARKMVQHILRGEENTAVPETKGEIKHLPPIDESERKMELESIIFKLCGT